MSSVKPTKSLALTPLTDIESRRLVELEASIRDGIETFLAVGSALLEIRDARLYRHEFDSYEAYCREKWGMSKTRANQLIAASSVVASLPPTASKPATESQARPLARLPKERRAEAWEAAAKSAKGGKPTAKQVESAVEAIAPKPEPPDIVAQRAAGIIPANVPVRVTEPEPASDPEPESPGEDGLSDAEWLALCPAREKLAAFARGRFDSDALTYRRLSQLRLKYSRACKPITNEAKRANRGHIGPYMGRHFHYLRLKHPKHWVPCHDCKGPDGLSAGKVPLIGDCPSCRGEGYLV